MNSTFSKTNNLKYLISLHDISTFRNKSSDLWGQFIRENKVSIALRSLLETYNFKSLEEF